jgi:hypothetical protein
MSESKIYPLYLSFGHRVSVFAPAGLFTVLGLLFLSGLLHGSSGGPPRFMGLVFFSVSCRFWYLIGSTPYKIAVLETAEIEFISVIRTKRLLFTDIESVKPDRGHFGFLIIRHRTGKIKLVNQFDGFHEFVLKLKAKNPSAEIRGC